MQATESISFILNTRKQLRIRSDNERGERALKDPGPLAGGRQARKARGWIPRTQSILPPSSLLCPYLEQYQRQNGCLGVVLLFSLFVVVVVIIL